MAALSACASSAAAQTSCDAARRFGFEFSTAAAQAMNYASSYNFAATNGVGGSVPFTVSFFTDGVASSNVGGTTLPRISNLINDGNPATANNLVVGMILSGRTADITSNTRVVRTIFTFASPIREFTVQVNDIDFNSNQYRDWLLIRGTNGAATYAPALSTPYGTNNGAGPRSGGASVVVLGNATTPLTIATPSEMMGNGLASNADDLGTITASFAQPVTSVSLTYGNSGQGAGGTTTGQQGYGIQYVRFCGMPALTVTKSSSSPAATGVDRFSVPGSDRIYTITLANTSGSTLDLDGMVMQDALPPNVTFFSGNFGPGITGPFDFVAGGGATVTNGGATFSSDGTNFTYTPNGSYDANVRAIRMNGVGSVPVGGTLTVRFRARIN